jgi:hypothetical protein
MNALLVTIASSSSRMLRDSPIAAATSPYVHSSTSSGSLRIACENHCFVRQAVAASLCARRLLSSTAFATGPSTEPDCER